jgi:hypothetical protein
LDGETRRNVHSREHEKSDGACCQNDFTLHRAGKELDRPPGEDVERPAEADGKEAGPKDQDPGDAAKLEGDWAYR